MILDAEKIRRKKERMKERKSSRLDTDSMLTSVLTWAGGESETK
jgi:hypothetical protein